jgi:hypothetical protein
MSAYIMVQNGHLGLSDSLKPHRPAEIKLHASRTQIDYEGAGKWPPGETIGQLVTPFAVDWVSLSLPYAFPVAQLRDADDPATRSDGLGESGG